MAKLQTAIRKWCIKAEHNVDYFTTGDSALHPYKGGKRENFSALVNMEDFTLNYLIVFNSYVGAKKTTVISFQRFWKVVLNIHYFPFYAL